MRAITFLIAALGFISAWAQPRNLIYNPVERGQHAGPKRIGVWEYSDWPGRVSLVINYDNGSLDYFEPDTSTFIIQDGTKWVKSKLLRPCRFHGSFLQLKDHYQSQLGRLSSKEAADFVQKQSATTLLTFDIGEDGTAVNPKLSGFAKLGFGQSLMDAFNSAPNSWISGIKEDGSPCVCRFGITLEYCLDSCSKAPSIPNKTIIRRVVHIETKPPGHENISINQDVDLGIQFSPDDRNILLHTDDMLSSAGLTQAFIIHADSGSIEVVPFQAVRGSFWLDNNRVFFKYSYANAGMFMAEYDRRTGTVTTKDDSVSYLNVPSPDGTKLAFVTGGKIGTRVWIYDDKVKFSKLLKTDPTKFVWVVGWSPDQSTVLLDMPGDDFDKNLIYDLSTGEVKLVPVHNVGFSGWSKDGEVYLRKLARGDYRYQGQLYAFNTKSGTVRELSGKVKDLTAAIYSSASGKFLIRIKDDLYLQDPKEEYKPLKIIDNVWNAAWSRDGKRIAFVHAKSRQVFVYDLESHKSKQVAEIMFLK